MGRGLQVAGIEAFSLGGDIVEDGPANNAGEDHQGEADSAPDEQFGADLHF
jgi:hypothetical protein